MRVLIAIILVSVFGGVLMNSCSVAPSFEIVPEISNPRFTSTTNPLNVSGGQDSVVLEFDFTDGDGDIGYDDNDPGYLTYDSFYVDTVLVDSLPFDTTYNFLKLTENRIPHVFLIRSEFGDTSTFSKIPHIPSNGGVPDISGTVRITILSSFFQGPCLAMETGITYSVFIDDRAFNRSNTISFNTIPLDCP